MNTQKPHITQRFTSLFVLVVFLLPAIVNFAHATEGHQHYDTCNTSDTHVHASKLDCNLGDMQMVKIGDYAFAKAFTFSPPIFQKTKTLFYLSTYYQIVEITSNRGPPYY